MQAAIGRLFVRVMLSRGGCVTVNVLALSVSHSLASSPKEGALGEEEKPHGTSKASPFGRGVTGGDGEGKLVRVGLLTQR